MTQFAFGRPSEFLMMTIRWTLLVACLAAAQCPPPAGAQSPPPAAAHSLQQFEARQPKMGTLFRLVMWAPDQATADKAADAAWARIDQINSELSDYDPHSELSRLCARTDEGPMTRPVAVSDDLWRILVHSAEAAKLSGGAFDITVGPLTRLQRISRKTGKPPTTQSLQDAREAVGWRYVKLDPAHRSVQLLHEKMRLDVGGIAKGFTSDEVLKVLKKMGVARALCGAAGDITAADPPPGRSEWRIGIQDLKNSQVIADYVKLHDRAISTSGDTYRSAEVNGKRYSHIVDPGTGLGLTRRVGVTTVAPAGVTADWSATAISVLGPARGIEMIDRIPGAAARVVTIDDKGREHVYESARFRKFLASEPAASAPAAHPVH